MTEDTTSGGDRPKGDRIAKLLARAGIASRRDIEKMIAEGRIALNGTLLDTPATILTSLKGVTVDGEPVAPPEAARLFLYHKPVGLLVTEWDPVGRPTIYDKLPGDLPRTMPVGRLDLNTEGLLLLTTDGGLKRLLELPATGVERTYRARAYGDVTQAMLEELIHGIEIDGVRYGSIDANLERRTGANVWIEMTLTEGKNREVRRVLEHLGLQVGRLIRTRYGPFVLGDLPPGAVGEVKQHDLVAFTKTLNGPRRGKGADLATLVTVEARPAPKIAPPVEPEPEAPPAPRREPEGRRRISPAPRAQAGSGGWGSRARPSRPAEPQRERDDRSARTFGLGAERPRTTRSGEGQRPAREDRTGGNQRFGSERPGDRRTARDGSERPARTERGAQGRRTGTDRFAHDRRPRRDEGDRAASHRSDAAARPPRGDGERGRDRFATDRAAPRGEGRDAGPAQGRSPSRGRFSPNAPGTRAPSAAARTPGATNPRRLGKGSSDGAPRPGRGSSGDASRPGKGPSGGRGHPPRAPKGKR
ncbi:pseudouridine synthase [Sphingomonas abaci]|uniref:Pseudouridine synthase n=1 Tax=Sphingomonas abaci TaxID=237611 RepID=A0A7W7EXE8_9SPHN|nr:pseudouridine synthase [Sphingomonas abaci]MBB4616996.1 23S rRNA pseudouridine2605 synthase [Sphingomonas abaci]